MKFPAETSIAAEKFTRYLLVPQLRSDKSRYLARAGYSPANVERLIEDLRSQILPLDATLSRSTPFGETYFIDGALTGPSGERIFVRTVWLRDCVKSPSTSFGRVGNARKRRERARKAAPIS